MSMSEFKVDDVVAGYMKLRLKKELIESEAKQKVADIKAKMELLENWLLQRMQAEGVDSYKTAHGTAYKTTTDFATVGDWDEVLGFIKEREAFHMLERRVNKIAVRDYINSGVVPPGVNYGTKVDVGFRKPSVNA